MRGCIGRPASLSLHIETMGSEKTMTFLLHKLHFTFKIASLCQASNLLRRIFIINKSYMNKRILFNSFTYLSVCVFHHSPLHFHITRTRARAQSILTRRISAYTTRSTSLYKRPVRGAYQLMSTALRRAAAAARESLVFSR